MFKKRVGRIEEAEKHGGGQFGQTNFEIDVDCYRESDLTVIKKRGGGCLELTHEEANKLADYLVGANKWLKTGKHMNTLYHCATIGQNVTIYEYVVMVKPEMIHISDNVQIDCHCRLEGGERLFIGDYVHVAAQVVLNSGGGTLVIGAHTGIAAHATILSGHPDLSFLPITPCEPPEDVHPVRKKTVIGCYVFIQAGAIILPGVTIGDGAVIKAGAVVTRDVRPFEIVSGIPAVHVGEREVLVR